MCLIKSKTLNRKSINRFAIHFQFDRIYTVVIE